MYNNYYTWKGRLDFVGVRGGQNYVFWPKAYKYDLEKI